MCVGRSSEHPNHDASLLPLDVAPSTVFSAVVASADVSILSFFGSLPDSSAGASDSAARLPEGVWSADAPLADSWSAFVSPAAVLSQDSAAASCDVVVPDADDEVEPASLAFSAGGGRGLVTVVASGSSGLS